MILALRDGAQHYKLRVGRFDAHDPNSPLVLEARMIRAPHQDEPRIGQAEGAAGHALIVRRLTTTPVLPFEPKASRF
jgi:hypothetical protein